MLSISGSMSDSVVKHGGYAKTERIQIIDALRGLSILLMMAYHFGYALYIFGFLNPNILFNPLLNVLQPIFAGLFIILCGVSSNFSRGNIKRGLKTLCCAAVISVVTWFSGMPIWFGILHFLGFCMIIYGLLGGYIEKLPRIPAIIFWVALFIVCYIFLPVLANNDLLAWLGAATSEFFDSSADYFPLGKWFFLFLCGTWLGKPIKEKRFPNLFYTFRIPVLPFFGRHTLILYMVHQPLYFGLLTLYIRLFYG